MRITSVKASVLEVPFKNPGLYLLGDREPAKSMKIIFVEMHTNEGITGYGFQEDIGGLSIPLINDIVSNYLVENKINLFDTEVISTYLRKIQPYSGQASAVEVAAWDVVGKACNRPISKLLGGFRDKIKAYVSTGELRSPEQRVEDVHRYMEQGFKAIKIKAYHEDPEEDLKVVEAIRKAVGNRIEIMVDAHYARENELSYPSPWTLKTAIRFAKRLEEMNVAWLEEPLPRTNKLGIAALCSAVDIPIAGGESEYGIYTYKEFLERGYYDIIQCDVTLSGGFLETKKIAALAQSYNKWCIPHGWSVGPGLIANLHLACSVPNCPYFEYMMEPPAMDIEMRDMLMTEPLLAEDGYVRLPEGPGLGIELNMDLIRKYTV